ncbi:glycosyltransferase family 2 protein [Pseudomonas japonica]|uniref:glycosyltransferase family 2 protein n=1 Tax=Pseudomonas japonica TaxID=256466 RepID=UPI0015E424DE|nr:glycosyltransferase family 2 protein [Pseudomonas japonica]MBA1241969.1 glycosyltransferase family 2 protein [Pseudomonas japonica]
MVTKLRGSLGSLRVHSVLYGNDFNRILQTVRHLNRAADLAIAADVFSSVEIIYGDSSPQQVIDEPSLDKMREEMYALADVNVDFFNANLGSAGGHNRLLKPAASDYVLIMNPDVMLAPDALIELARPYSEKSVGLVEARQLPIEHPKEYNKVTGETGWATTACALMPRDVVNEIGGFDNETFFLYCDDVDLSWRMRLAGYKVIYQPSASVYHDKRLSTTGKWAPTNSEQYYSAEAAILMAHKYSRPDLVSSLLHSFESSENRNLTDAAEKYHQLKQENKLPEPIDPSHKVASFEGDFYTKHRFGL